MRARVDGSRGRGSDVRCRDGNGACGQRRARRDSRAHVSGRRPAELRFPVLLRPGRARLLPAAIGPPRNARPAGTPASGRACGPDGPGRPDWSCRAVRRAGPHRARGTVRRPRLCGAHRAAGATRPAGRPGIPGSHRAAGPAGPPGPSAVHGLRQFSASGTFVPPDGVTTAFLQLWGAGGGGAGVRPNGSNGTGGGGGGFVWCTVQVQPGQPHTVTIGEGGAGGPANTAGTQGGLSLLSAPPDNLARSRSPRAAPVDPLPPSEVARRASVSAVHPSTRTPSPAQADRA
ncbi:glycine-rich domain-containing protein [Streptomyces sp. NPDC006207]